MPLIFSNPQMAKFQLQQFWMFRIEITGLLKVSNFHSTVNFVPHTQRKVCCQISVMSSWPVPSHTGCSIVIVLLHFWLVLSIGIWFGILVLDKIHFPVTRRRKRNLQYKGPFNPRVRLLSSNSLLNLSEFVASHFHPLILSKTPDSRIFKLTSY